MREIVDVLNAVGEPKAKRVAAQQAFMASRSKIWRDIQDGKFPATYHSAGGRKYTGAPRRTALRCDFLMANKIALELSA